MNAPLVVKYYLIFKFNTFTQMFIISKLLLSQLQVILHFMKRFVIVVFKVIRFIYKGGLKSFPLQHEDSSTSK